MDANANASATRRSSFDYVICGGGVSGLYLAALLHEKFPRRTICIVNKDGAPSWLWKTYMLNLVGVAVPCMVPSIEYRYRSHANQFANCTYLGGNSNINAAVCPVPLAKDIELSMGRSFVEVYEKFVRGPELDRLSTPTPRPEGLERLSDDLRRAGLPGGNIRAFTDGFRRIHPLDFIPMDGPGSEYVTIKKATVDRVVFDRTNEQVQAVICTSEEGTEKLVAMRKTIICCGALESPKLLMRSGIGPRQILNQILRCEDDFVHINEAVGTNLQDHWVGRASASFPERYRFPFYYPRVLGYKHRYKDVALGFGKLQFMGRNLLSIATANCLNPGRIIVGRNGQLEPYLPPGIDDLLSYNKHIRELRTILGTLGIDFTPTDKPLAPNWHYSCTLSIGTCVDDHFKVKGVKGLYVVDASVLKTIIPMNTQIVSYFIPYAFTTLEP